jgi:hypothetical protein
MRSIRFACLALAISALAGLSAQPALADEAAAVYDPSTVFFIDLTLSEKAETDLEAEPGEYVSGIFSMTKSSDGTPAGEEATPFISERPVEVRLKGSVGGSFRELSEKPGFKLKFKKANAVLGLRKMTLNNMVQDPSMLHETLAYAAFRANGVPASRTGFAYVRLNAKDIGVYLDLENLDDIGLGRIFGVPFDDKTQHLYEGEQGDDVFPGGEAGFEVDEGSEEDTGDLEALIEAASGEGAGPWSDRVAPHAELIEMARMWAVEKYIDHWDGYSGHTEPAQAGERPNNYYLYGEPSGRFQMLPWGTDQAWIPTIEVETPGREVTFDGKGGVLFNKCLEDEECFRLYWEALRAVTSTIAALGPASLAEDTAGLLAPWQAEEFAHGRPEYDPAEIKEDKYGVDNTVAFINGRQAEAEAWLAAHKPPPADIPRVPPPVHVQPGPSPLFLFSSAARSGRQLTARVQVAAAGFVSVRATIKAGKVRRRVCKGGARAGAAGEIALSCKLSRLAIDALEHGALRVKLVFTTMLNDGRTETVVRFKRLARS